MCSKLPLPLLLDCVATRSVRSVDCWALGVLTFEFTAGFTPFQPPGESGDITALFTRIAGSKVAFSGSVFPKGYDARVSTHEHTLP